MLMLIIIISCWIYGKDMYYRENPASIFVEESTNHPELFKIRKDNMNFA